MYLKLKKLRISHSYTLSYMAEELKISRPYYCQLEGGKRNLSYKNAVKIAAIFNKKPDEIFYDTVIKKIK